MDPTNLPNDVADIIFTFLPVKDLLSCSLVNCGWRAAVNKDVIWKQHCTLKINLENLECAVEPVFELPQSVCENLTSVCKYRQNYMREIHLKNNYRQNRYTEQVARIKGGLNNVATFLDRLIISCDDESRELCVWSVEENPIKVDSVRYAISCPNGPYLQCTEKYCVLVMNTLMQVYVVVDGKLNLIMNRIFDKEEMFSEKIPTIDMSVYHLEDEPLSNWYESTVGYEEINVRVSAVSHYFIGVGNIGAPPHCNQAMHIWDLETGQKLKKQIVSDNGIVEKLYCNVNSENLYIILSCDEQNTSDKCQIFYISQKSMQHTEFCVELNEVTSLNVGEKIIILEGKRLNNSYWYIIFDSITGEKVIERQVNNLTGRGILYDSMFVYCSDCTVAGVDVNTHEKLFQFSVFMKVETLNLFYSNLLLVGGWNFTKNCPFLIGDKCTFELWDIEKMSQLYQKKEEVADWLYCLKQTGQEVKIVFQVDEGVSNVYEEWEDLVSIVCFRNYW